MRLKFALLMLVISAGTHLSATAEPVEIAGAWSFETVIKQKGCTISGNMHIEMELDGARQCAFTASEVCDGSPEDRITVEQTCRILKQGNFYLIRSRVSQSLTQGYSGASYLPDHFTVKPEGPNRMAGTWHDRQYTDSTTFWRDREAPVS